MKATEKIFVGAILAIMVAVCGCWQGSRRDALNPSDRLELKTLTDQLTDAGRSGKTRYEAARLLLNRPNGEARQVILDCLKNPANPPAQIAVAEAIADAGGADKAFLEPLLALLAKAEQSVDPAVGRALATYKGYGVADELIELATDARRPMMVRIAAIDSLGLVLEKRIVETMVSLMDDSDKTIRDTSAGSLAKLTGIRSFGLDKDKWKTWWDRNKNKEQSEWLADLADGLAKAKEALEAENSRLRERLVEAETALYTAASANQREAMLMSFLKDPLPDVRLVGTRLTNQRLSANEAVPDEVIAQVRTMLGDSDARLRRAAAMLLASLDDGQSVTELLDRLEVEQDSSVREGLLIAIGQLRDPKALQAVLGEIPSPSDAVSAAAAAALGRISEAYPLDDKAKTEAAKALMDRYNKSGSANGGAQLRESLLTAMGKAGDESVVKVLSGAVKAPAATIRLAAVNSLAKVGDRDASSLIVPLVADDDRGVRQAAITALGTLDGDNHLAIILSRTNPSIEADAAVQQQAWDVAMGILVKSDVETLKFVAEKLAKRTDASSRRITILQMLVEKLTGTEGLAEAKACRELGLALIQADRPAEGGPYLYRAWRAYRNTASAEATGVWNEWIDALLKADDPALIKALQEQNDKEEFEAAVFRLCKRLLALNAGNKHAAAIALGRAVLKEFPSRLTPEQKDTIEKLLGNAKAELKDRDSRLVARLIEQLQAGDEAVRKAAVVDLQAMGERAVPPLLEQLKRCLTAEDAPEAADANLKKEEAILAALSQIAPELNKAYNLEAPKDDKLKLINGWLKKD